MQSLLRHNVSVFGRTSSRFAVQHARTMASGKDIYFGTEARAKMLMGVDKLAEAVKVTLGPKVCPKFSQSQANASLFESPVLICVWTLRKLMRPRVFHKHALRGSQPPSHIV